MSCKIPALLFWASGCRGKPGEYRFARSVGGGQRLSESTGQVQEIDIGRIFPSYRLCQGSVIDDNTVDGHGYVLYVYKRSTVNTPLSFLSVQIVPAG